MAHKPKKPNSAKSNTHLLMPDGSKVKWPTSKVSGVYFRDDSKTKKRWEVKLRWTDELGNRQSRTHAKFTVELTARLGTTKHIETARQAAEAEANRQWAKIGGAKKAGTAIYDEQEITLGKWCADYLDELERSQLPEGHKERPIHPIHNKGWAQEASLLRTILGQAKSGENMGGFPEFTSLRIAEVSTEYVLDILKARMKGRGGKPASNSSIKKVFVQLSLVYNRARLEWQFKVENPFAETKELFKLKKLVIADQRTITIDRNDFRLVMRAMRYAHIVTKSAIYFDLDSSCRRSEAVKLNWQDIDWSGEVVSAVFHDTKSTVDNPRHRTIPVIGKALTALRAMAVLQRYEDVMGVRVKERIWEGNFRDGQTQWDKLPRPTHAQWEEMRTPPLEGPVFRLEGKRLRADSVTQAWIRARDKVAEKKPSIKAYRVHDLRHTGVTKLVDLGELSALAVAAIVGHSNLQTTNRYYHGNAKAIGSRLKRNLKNASSSAAPDKAKLLEQLKNLPKKERAALLAELMGGD